MHGEYRVFRGQSQHEMVLLATAVEGHSARLDRSIATVTELAQQLANVAVMVAQQYSLQGAPHSCDSSDPAARSSGASALSEEVDVEVAPPVGVPTASRARAQHWASDVSVDVGSAREARKAAFRGHSSNRRRRRRRPSTSEQQASASS